MKKTPKQFAQEALKKSNKFYQTTVAIDSTDQLLAETKACPELVEYIKTSIEGELSEIPMKGGTLKLYKREPGIYGGFFQDDHGQILDKFADQTIEMVAKNLELKEIYERPPVPEVVEEKTPTTVNIRMGDVEIEIKKSLVEFVSDFKRNKIKKSTLEAVRAWRRNSHLGKSQPSDLEAARAILREWESVSEEFKQTIFAINFNE